MNHIELAQAFQDRLDSIEANRARIDDILKSTKNPEIEDTCLSAEIKLDEIETDLQLSMARIRSLN